MEAQIWGRLQNNQDSSESWPLSQAEQSGKKGFGKRGDQEPDGHSGWAPEIRCGEGGNPSRRTSITATLHQPIWALWQGGQTEASPQLGVFKRAPKVLRMWETRFSGLIKPRLNCLASILSVMSGGNQAPLITCPIPFQRWSMVVAAPCCGVFSAAGTGGLVRVEGKLNRAKNRDILNETLVQSAHDLRLVRRFTFQPDNDPQHTAKSLGTTVNVCEWSSQSPDIEPNQKSLEKMAVHRRSPSNMTEFERICRE